MFSPEIDRLNEFANYGYWDENTRTEVEACENLIEKLLAFVPEKQGTILDVPCGKGATTRHLLKYWLPEHPGFRLRSGRNRWHDSAVFDREPRETFADPPPR